MYTLIWFGWLVPMTSPPEAARLLRGFYSGSKEGAMKTFQANTGEGESTNTRLMGASGPTQHGEDINVLMVAMTPSDREPLVLLELMYMDPRQFVAPNRGES